MRLSSDDLPMFFEPHHGELAERLRAAAPVFTALEAPDAHRDEAARDRAAVKALASLQRTFVGMASVGDTVTFAAAGMAVLRSSALPRGVGLLALLGSLLALVTVLLVDVEAVAIVEGVVAMLWVVVTSVLLLRRTPDAIDALRN